MPESVTARHEIADDQDGYAYCSCGQRFVHAGARNIHIGRMKQLAVKPVLPSGRTVGTCADCYTWHGPRGSAHDPGECPHRQASIRRARIEIEALRQRLADLTGEPA